jgi:tetratricopeptide (TPR) repeat protein
MRKIAALILLLSLFPATSNGQNLQHYQEEIYKSYIGGDMGRWEAALQGMERLHERQPSARLLYNILLAQYGLTGYYLGTGERSRARQLIAAGESNLEQLKAHARFRSRQLALEGAFLGFRISLSPLRAVALGPRSMGAIDRALEADPFNPTAHLEKANALYYAPAIFGGSKTAAIDHYRQAIQLMEQQQQPDHRWLYLSTLVALATAYESTGEISLAIATLQKALSSEPGFKWVRDELLPQMQQQQ